MAMLCFSISGTSTTYIPAKEFMPMCVPMHAAWQLFKHFQMPSNDGKRRCWTSKNINSEVY